MGGEHARGLSSAGVLGACFQIRARFNTCGAFVVHYRDLPDGSDYRSDITIPEPPSA